MEYVIHIKCKKYINNICIRLEFKHTFWFIESYHRCGLVDGVVSDDSDSLCYGAKIVYRWWYYHLYYLFNKLLPILLKILFFSFFVPVDFFRNNFHSSWLMTQMKPKSGAWCPLFCLILWFFTNVLNWKVEKVPFYILWFLGKPSFP